MIVVGLTGGIGSGKSTASAELAAMGAVVIDADATARELQQPGGSVFLAMVELLGEEIVAPDGTLDRQRVAEMVFPDPELLAQLNAISHPAIGRAVRDKMREHLGTDRVVILDVPLLIENTRYPIAGIVVVDTPVEVAVHRLVTYRKMDEADARARIARQATREERISKADKVIDNSGSPAELSAQLPAIYAWMQSLPPVADDDPRLYDPVEAHDPVGSVEANGT